MNYLLIIPKIPITKIVKIGYVNKQLKNKIRPSIKLLKEVKNGI